MHKKNDKTEFEQGYFYKVSLNDGTAHEGVFVSQTDNFVYLKLTSGYNIGIAKSSVSKFAKKEEVSSFEKEDKEKDSSGKVEHPEIIILHTGGTIASKVDYSTGAVLAKFTPDEMVALFPELKNMGTIDSKLIRNMSSDDMRLEHYNVIAKEIEKALKNKSLKGIILTHGTDTLHYTS
jgi:glutamyl-tRNA(Gln) amidotransferase subunit D